MIEELGFIIGMAIAGVLFLWYKRLELEEKKFEFKLKHGYSGEIGSLKLPEPKLKSYFIE